MVRRWPSEPVSGHRREICDRCKLAFREGYTWPGLGVPLVLCKECTEDIEDSVRSYGEDPRAAQVRLLDRLRAIGA
jgi:hypothetical protein